MRLGLNNVGPAPGLEQASIWMVYPPGAQHCLWPIWSQNMFKPAASHSSLLCAGFMLIIIFFNSSTCSLCWQTQTLGGFSRFLSELWAGLSNAKGLFSELENLVTPCTLHPQGFLPSPFCFIPFFLHFLQRSGHSVVFVAANIVVTIISEHESWTSQDCILGSTASL